MNDASAEGFQEWISSIMYSNWFYVGIAAMGLFSFVMLVFGMVWLFRRNSHSPSAADSPAAPETDSAFESSPLLTAVGKLNGRPKCILLAAGSLHDLPVTIPVNAAIHLAATCKCLLIDLDTKRDALACVFEMNDFPFGGSPTPVPTPIENLDIWPAHFFSRLHQMDIKAVLSAAQQKYDVILLNAPYLAAHPDRGRIVRCTESAVVFARDRKTAQPLVQLLETGACKILKTLDPNGRPFA